MSLLSCLLITAATNATAEIGVPAASGGYYVTIEGGYRGGDTPEVAAQGERAVVGDGLGANILTAPSRANATGTTVVAPLQSTASGSGSGSQSAAASGVTINETTGSGAGVGVGREANAEAFAQNNSATNFASANGGDFIDAANGGFVGGSIGYVMPNALFGTITRLEAFASGWASQEDESQPGALGLRSVDNNIAIAFAAVPSSFTSVSIEQDVSLIEYGMRLKSDLVKGPSSLALSFEPFYMRFNQESVTQGSLTPIDLNNSVGASAHRASDVDSNIFGAQIAVEGTAPLAGKFSFVARASGGLYHIRGTGEFSSRFRFGTGGGGPFVLPDASLEDSDSKIGYRLGAQAGLRYALSATSWFTLTGSVDYLSDMSTAVLPRFSADPAAHVGFDNLLDWRVGLRYTAANF